MITSHNHAAFVVDAVRSALNQTRPPLEVIVIDDGSTDDSLALLHHLAMTEPRLRVVAQNNEGVVAARNRGLHEAVGDWVVLLDSDDTLAPDFLERTVAAWLTSPDPRVAFVYTDALLAGTASGLLRSRPFSAFALSLGNYVLNCCLLSRVAAVEIGGYDRVFEDGGHEDWDFFLRLAEVGYRGRYVRQPLVHYRQHDDASRNARSVAEHAQVVERMIARHPRTCGRPMRRRILRGPPAVIRAALAVRRGVLRMLR